MTSTERVIQIRQRDPVRRAGAIAQEIGISRERVRQILNKVGLDPAPHGRGAPLQVKPITKSCSLCGKLITRPPYEFTGQRVYCGEVHWVTLQCHVCEKVFTRRAYQVGKKTQHHFCSHQCKGGWAGKNYGFAARPENIRKGLPSREGQIP